MKTKVKICGIKTMTAAKAAVDAGADFLGFNFVTTSKRYINPAIALKIINLIRDQIKVVGVFQDEKITNVNKIAPYLKLDFVQLHGSENNQYIKHLKLPIIKVIQINDNPKKYNADYFLIDRPCRKGLMVNFEKAAQLAAKFPLFFAGGLNPGNVAEVIKKVRPFVVDVAGGIETDGHQDPEKIKIFIKNAKEAI